MSAHKDPIILRRRQIAARMWTAGYSGQEILTAINTWLESEAERPIKLFTVYKDKMAIVKQWQEDYHHELAESLATHVATYNRAKRDAFRSYEDQKEGPAGAAYLNAAMKAEENISKLDGTLKTALEVSAPGGEPLMPAQQGWDLSAFSSDQLRTFLALIEIAGGGSVEDTSGARSA